MRVLSVGSVCRYKAMCCVYIHIAMSVYMCMGGRLYMPAVCTDTCVWVHVPG